MESKMKEMAREQKAEEKQVEEEAKKEQEEISVTERIVAFETVATEPTPGARQNIVDSGDIKVEVHATAVHHDQVVEPKMAHAMSHEISHSQATYSVRRVEVGEKRSVYVTVAFAGVALMVAMLIGVVVVRRRSSRFPQHQLLSVQTAKIGNAKEGFIE